MDRKQKIEGNNGNKATLQMLQTLQNENNLLIIRTEYMTEHIIIHFLLYTAFPYFYSI